MACQYVYLAVNRVPSFLRRLVTLYKVGRRRWSEIIYTLNVIWALAQLSELMP
jgi:hypothetical protein